MTDPQLPPPSGAVPPAPPAFPAPQSAAPGAQPERPAAPAAAPAPQPPAAFPPPAAAPSAPVTPAAPPAYPAAAPSYPAAPAYPAVPQAPAVAQAPAPQAPPGAYHVPVGGYAAPQGGYVAPQVAPTQSGGFLGILSLILAGIAAIIIPIIAGVAGFEIGVRIPSGIDTTDPDFLSALSPARTQVLWAEIAFWVGTALGIAAIVVGIIAIRKKQRRALGIVGMVLAVLGAAIFWIVLVATLSAGMATGFVNY
ncbi:hypothetical protein ACI3KT_08300 [Microbacterium sp. ZW T6_19]|uniref:hypothetical protein n=1 Tax=unclassified Microbacterium TaxID=2609290 RepID=UPI0025EE238A|nr:hypothetical protein [Microbacterium sp.]